MTGGSFIISLDFELFWGVRDKRSKENYSDVIVKVWDVIPKMLELFNKYEITATFATVGFLFAEELEDLLKYKPDKLPDYVDANLSPYTKYISRDSFLDKRLHFAKSLIEQIIEHKHEIATHTFSHYYCLEKGQTLSAFEADLEAAAQISYPMNYHSIVFPRNQYNAKSLQVCHKQGIVAFRGNEKSWVYATEAQSEEGLFKRAVRLMDSYMNLTGHHLFVPEKIEGLVNVPASRFLRPYSRSMSWLEPIKLNRIKNSMTEAARQEKSYHLWWHPHNFGLNTDENFRNLERVAKHYKKLNENYGWRNASMREVAQIHFTNE